MHAGIMIMVIGVGWTMLALVVAAAVGSVARDRDVGAGPSIASPAHEDGYRTAI